MNVELLKVAGGRLFGGLVLRAKKHAPEILTGLGIASGVAATVLAVKATVELVKNDEFADANMIREKAQVLRQTRIADIDSGTNELGKYSIDGVPLEDYSEATYRKDLVIAFVRKVEVVVKRYAIPASLGAASIACILAGHGILKSRNTSLVAAYSVLDASYKAYRKRVVEEFGEQKDWDYRHGIREEVVETKDEKTGKVKKSKEIIRDPNGYSPYARFFDETNPNWNSREQSLNLFFLRCQQTWANDRLHARGFLLLNEVYRDLGLPETSAGAIVGWVLENASDGFVDFGLYDPESPAARDFVNGFGTHGILLDFNVDGVIYNKIDGLA